MRKNLKSQIIFFIYFYYCDNSKIIKFISVNVWLFLSVTQKRQNTFWNKATITLQKTVVGDCSMTNNHVQSICDVPAFTVVL